MEMEQAALPMGLLAMPFRTGGTGRHVMQSAENAAVRLMTEFSDRTRLGHAEGSKRYLWTDAFALVNALHLWRTTREPRWRDFATTLISDVHGVLGRHRLDDPRTGWLSGLPEAEGARHPTCGGLRIGKPMPERLPSEPRDDHLEWDRDGQYWHYLTKWMDALYRAAVVLGDATYHRYAVGLAEATFPRFLRAEGGGLAWKMSIDLSRPQVTGVSLHDALDGYVTFRCLARGDWPTALSSETRSLWWLVEDEAWATGDPLGLGGLLLDAGRVALLSDRAPEDERLIAAVLAGVDLGLTHFLRSGTLDQRSAKRLGFRELGLAIGLQMLPPMSDAADVSPGLGEAGAPYLERLGEHGDAGARIVAFWSDPENRQAASWTEHRDINEVMLATALLRSYTRTVLAG